MINVFYFRKLHHLRTYHSTKHCIMPWFAYPSYYVCYHVFFSTVPTTSCTYILGDIVVVVVVHSHLLYYVCVCVYMCGPRIVNKSIYIP